MFWRYHGGAPGHARVGVMPSVPRGDVTKEQNTDPTPAESAIVSEESAKQTLQELEEAEEIDWYTWTDVESDDDVDNADHDNSEHEHKDNDDREE